MAIRIVYTIYLSTIFCDTANVFRSTYDIDILREPLDLTDYSKFTPTSTLTGNLRKKWVIDKDGNRFLVKGNSGRSAQQSINEVFISEIHKKQHIFTYVQYKLALLNVKGYKVLGCASKCFVTQETDFVPAVYIVRGHKMLQLYDLYRFFIEESNKLGIRLDYLKNYIDYQIMIDFITTNLDRHLNNFGLMRLVSSGKYYLIAPIFDSGNSLGSTLHYIPTSRGILNIKTQVGSFKEREIELLRYVKNRQLVDVKKLPTIQDLYTLLKKDPFIRESEIEKIQQLYQAKIDIFSDFQSGIDVWRPEYRYTGTQLDDIEDLFDV